MAVNRVRISNLILKNGYLNCLLLLVPFSPLQYLLTCIKKQINRVLHFFKFFDTLFSFGSTMIWLLQRKKQGRSSEGRWPVSMTVCS